MPTFPIFIGESETRPTREEVSGHRVQLEGESYYRIDGYDRMRPFLMSVVSPSDHWLFLSSAGPLTAGRRNPESALFPYCTDDKIHDAVGVTGPQTIVLVTRGDRTSLWEPFSPRYEGAYSVRRSLYKNTAGNRVLFEEVNEDLGVVFRQSWSTGEQFGFIRRATLRNRGADRVRVRFLDGVLNLLPSGVDPGMQGGLSTLVDAYKKNELVAGSQLGLFTLSSVPVDRAEPSESLRATTVWCVGLGEPTVLLSSLQVDAFRAGSIPREETDVRAERGCYLVHADQALEPGEESTWYLVAEVDQGPASVANLSRLLTQDERLPARLEEDISAGTRRLARIVGSADGLEVSEDRAVCDRHFTNVLFNVMRGGAFLGGSSVAVADLRRHVRHFNLRVAEEHAELIDGVGGSMAHAELLAAARRTQDPDLERLCLEYLPLSFSRRHGDPSRPWNRFSIEVKDDAGRELLHYEGNWRDIFQNWEALGRSHPGFLPSMVCRFLNASTADGHNPYRITRDGIDWEVPNPDDPWAFIGYWGDHQVVYLLKLLELLQQHEPGALQDLMGRKIFAYADVPYRIKPYEELLASPSDTIVFDHAVQARVEERVARAGADGKLLHDESGHLCRANLADKLLLLVLARLSNLVHEGGIWLNTQRPEWNDANNALVGNGLSMVTLGHLRRCLGFLQEVFPGDDDSVEVASELSAFFAGVRGALEEHARVLARPTTPQDRRSLLDALGSAGSAYRRDVYRGGFSGRTERVSGGEIQRFLDLGLRYLDHSIRQNRRDDGLYHTYNLLQIGDDSLRVSHLYEMLEGQVAVLSSGALTADESLSVLDALRSSALYREDQESYLLYPDRDLPRYVEKNVIPSGAVQRSSLATRLVADGDRRLIERDDDGGYHWSGAFRNAGDVRAALAELRGAGYAALVGEDAELILELFEETFDHESFTGRSGTFFGYEGLGCIYWHMVSKLLLAAQEVCAAAEAGGASAETYGRLEQHYRLVRQGLGFNKSPAEYGAFPTDPYSHTPGHGGAQQPGMTGQVKEDILARWGELGVTVEGACIRFHPALLDEDELLTSPAAFTFHDLAGHERALQLEAGSLAFTYCGVPVVYRRGSSPGLTLVRDGQEHASSSLTLDRQDSALIFARTGRIERVEVCLALE